VQSPAEQGWLSQLRWQLAFVSSGNRTQDQPSGQLPPQYIVHVVFAPSCKQSPQFASVQAPPSGTEQIDFVEPLGNTHALLAHSKSNSQVAPGPSRGTQWACVLSGTLRQ
jgi:hypothetical protein